MLSRKMFQMLLIACSCMLLVPVGTAVAQQELSGPGQAQTEAPAAPGSVTAPPSPTIRRAPPQWLGLGVMFLLTIPVLLISLMPSKRSHQD